MARKRTIRRRRGSISHMRKRPSKFTAIKVTKVAIALGPVAITAYEGFKEKGAVGVSEALTASYTGFKFDGSFDAKRLIVGYVPLLGAYVFGKVASRVIRM